jgi:hypothetical protein
MSDFFSRLAERTLAVEPVVRADLPPLVAAASESVVDAAPMQRENVVVRNDAAREEVDMRRFDQSDQRILIERPSAQAERHAERAGVEPQRGQRSTTSAATSVLLPRPPSSFETRELSLENTGADGANEFRKSQAPAEFANLSTRREPVVTLPARERISPSEPAWERLTPAPAIHVSIGRIEVRAVTAPPPRSGAPAQRPAARLSLEQYLRERNEGRR